MTPVRSAKKDEPSLPIPSLIISSNHLTISRPTVNWTDPSDGGDILTELTVMAAWTQQQQQQRQLKPYTKRLQLQ